MLSNPVGICDKILGILKKGITLSVERTLWEMTMKFRNYLAVLCAMAMPAFADNQALVIANANYQYTHAGVGSDLTFQVVDRLRKAGYRVQKAQNLNKASMERVVSEFNASAQPRDHLVYVFVGHMLNDGSATYLTPVDLQAPRGDTIAQSAMNLDVILNHAAKHSGAASVFLGWTKPKKRLLKSRKYAFRGAPGLNFGLGQINVPQGVLVVNGIAQRTVNAINTQFFEPNRSTRAVGNTLVGHVRSQGYLSLHAYLNRADDEVSPEPDADLGIEQSFWDFTKQENTIQAYDAFVKRFPNGKYATVARTTLAKMRADALIGPAERAERALELTRDEKQDIQRALTVLGHDTRGVDGLLGPASRRAIKAWQASHNRRVDGFLDDGQVRAILEQGANRRRALTEEAKRKRAKLEAEDRAFWRATGASGQEYDLRVYLNKYPDGLFSQSAQISLDRIVAEKTRKTNNGAEVKVWRGAVQQNTVASYRNYLRQYQRGVFSDEAKSRIQKLNNQDANRKKNAEAHRIEKSMKLNKVMWLVVERQLANSGLNTGKVDGVVDQSTRRALRQFQKVNDLPATGFMNPNTLSRVFIR
jgi:peptidoglycan hydrolase-like protein with peptidoglycan-binding domain